MRREYHSSLRDERARETRLRIRKAARALFSSRGFAAATVADIAEAAGVSPATVYATYESKGGIVSAMLEELEEDLEIGARLRVMFAEPDPRARLRLFVAAHCALFEGGADILRAALQVVENAEVAGLAERGDARRRTVIEELVRGWREAGVLRSGLGEKEAADCMWLLTTVQSFLTAVDGLSWTPSQYEEWLSHLLDAEILG
jgi:AcrR family transcriptional regulator